MENIEKTDRKQERIVELFEMLVAFLGESAPDEKLPRADAIFVFGHFDPRVAIQAAKLWKMGKAPKIILSGRGRDKIPDEYESEADFYAALIKKEGVPASDLILEKESTNTLENVRFGIKASRADGYDPQSLILCAMPPLLRRSIATFQKQFPEISVHCSAFSMPASEWFTPIRIHRIIGEFDRLNRYVEKGDIAPTQIPESIRTALKEFRELGLD